MFKMNQTNSRKYYLVRVMGLDTPIRLTEQGGKALSDRLTADNPMKFVSLTDRHTGIEQVIRVSNIERIEPREAIIVQHNLIGAGKEELSRTELNKIEYSV